MLLGMLIGAGCLVLGILIGWAFTRGRVRTDTRLVFPTVREPPLIIEVERPRIQPNNSRGQTIKEDGRTNGCQDTDEFRAEDTVCLLREARSRGLG